jgi:hypothetical protein
MKGASLLLALGPTARVLRWPPVLASFMPALALVEHVAADLSDASGVLLALRGGAVALAVGLAFVLDDPAESLTAPSPVSLLAQRAVRMSLALPLAVAFCVILVTRANGAPGIAEPLSGATMLLELLAFAAVALAAAAVGSRLLADRLGGLAGVAGAAVAAVAASLLPWGEPLAARLPGTAAYGAVTRCSWTALVVGVAVLIGASSPYAGALRRPARRAAGTGVL